MKLILGEPCLLLSVFDDRYDDTLSVDVTSYEDVCEWMDSDVAEWSCGLSMFFNFRIMIMCANAKSLALSRFI